MSTDWRPLRLGQQVQSLPVTEEVNMFKDDGKVLHFSAPKGASLPLFCLLVAL